MNLLVWVQVKQWFTIAWRGMRCVPGDRRYFSLICSKSFNLLEIEWFKKLLPEASIFHWFLSVCFKMCDWAKKSSSSPHLSQACTGSLCSTLCMWTFYPENPTEFAAWNILVICPILPSALILFWRNTHIQKS